MSRLTDADKLEEAIREYFKGHRANYSKFRRKCVLLEQTTKEET